MTESVLFICDDNSVLSQMAEAFLHRHGWSTFKAYSAGIEPKAVNIFTFQVMEEIGHDLYGYHAKSIFEFNHLQHIDYLVTLSDYVNDYFIFNQDAIGCRLHWSFNNPTNEPGLPPGNNIPVHNIFPTTRFDSIPNNPWLSSNDDHLETKQEIIRAIYEPSQEKPQKNNKEILARFRSVRDQMECQVMNWLDEKGVGPLWWRGK